MKFLARVFGNSQNDEDLLTLLERGSCGLIAVKNLVAAGANVRCIEVRWDVRRLGYRGFTPLHHACDAHNPERAGIVRYLLERGANPNAKSKYGHTPLHVAALGDAADIEVVELLLEAGAAVHTFNSSGETPLHNAASAASYKAVEHFLAAGADINAQRPARGTGSGYAPLHSAVSGYGAHEGKIRVIKLLVSRGARLDARTKLGPMGETPLDRAQHLLQVTKAGGSTTNKEITRREEIVELLRWLGSVDPQAN